MDGLIYFKDGDLIAKSGDVNVYEMNDKLFLEIGPGHTLWALESELKDYVNQLGDKPNGKCLEIGLGLGVASNYILSCPKVKSLTTVEKNSDVINIYERICKRWEHFLYKKHRIVNADGLTYMLTTSNKYDFIFLDFYSLIDEDTLPEIMDMVSAARQALTNKGILVGWLDQHTPPEFISLFEAIFKD